MQEGEMSLPMQLEAQKMVLEGLRAQLNAINTLSINERQLESNLEEFARLVNNVQSVESDIRRLQKQIGDLGAKGDFHTNPMVGEGTRHMRKDHGSG
jgi:DNA anti-recombination protein RmuC